MSSPSAVTGIVLGVIFGVGGVIFLLLSAINSVIVVREKEQVILERFGRFARLLTPGLHFIIPWVERPKQYSQRFYVNDAHGNVVLVHKVSPRIDISDQVLDLPKQQCITRDNALCTVDVLLNYRIVNAKTCVYSTTNLALTMSKLLQAQVRNVVGSLDVDSLIEETSSPMDKVASELNAVAQRWGVQVSFVKFQRVDAGSLSEALSKKKNADLTNTSVIIQAKAKKQTDVINAEGQRDRMIREAEGEAQQIRSRARGEAKAIVNAATAEAESVREIARAVARSGEDPAQYLLKLKYVDALRTVLASPNTSVDFIPAAASQVSAMAQLGMQPTFLADGTGSGAGAGHVKSA